MPRIDVDVLDRKDIAPAGAGETPIMALAPAISNAIFAATGIRLRALPMVPQGLPPSGTSIRA
jgi:isoquinoline 1-oxidoreductase